jgi:beta-1,4-mannosyl-glycoprotein beta-1,4-N-acetylglucosaminyltransferase
LAVIDCFLYSGELDLLRLRLLELDHLVDRFVVVECTTTFTGVRKAVTLTDDMSSLGSLSTKIHHVVVDDAPTTGNPWLSEFYQRDALARGLADARSEDVVLIGDVDELPSPASLQAMCERLEQNMVGAFSMTPYNYGFNWRFRRDWTKARAVRAGTLRIVSPEEVRMLHSPDFVVPNAGWHFSNFYPRVDIVERLQSKIASVSHTEFANSRYTSRQYLELCVFGGINWSTVPPFRIKMDFVPLGGHLPASVIQSPEDWGPYLWSQEDRRPDFERRANRLHNRQMLREVLSPLGRVSRLVGRR